MVHIRVKYENKDYRKINLQNVVKQQGGTTAWRIEHENNNKMQVDTNSYTIECVRDREIITQGTEDF